MQQLLFKTKNGGSVNDKPRVYFTCHPDDFERTFTKVCEDIFKTHDCAIFYTEDMIETLPEATCAFDLERMNLFVVPVTIRLLTTPNRANDFDLKFAKDRNIAILPIMFETGIDSIYSRPENFGNRQYLAPFEHDPSAISYEEKLKKYLESTLFDDKTVERIRKAFDAYIFLSYRKMDRVYANDLMKLIHSEPRFRDLAIWYDEFLTPGEEFDKEIESALSLSKLFAMVVTPNLCKYTPEGKPNYVITEEYPKAKRILLNPETSEKLPILPIKVMDMGENEQNALTDKFPGLPQCIDGRKLLTLSEAMYENMKQIALRKNDADPEHNYLIGLAYLNGIDVETNSERGRSLIASAADAELPEAMIALANMYHDGISVQINFSEELKWREREYEYEKKIHGEEHPASLIALRKLAQTHHCLHNRLQFMSLNEEVYSLQCKVLGEDHPDSIMTLCQLATAYYQFALYDRAIDKAQKAYDQSIELWGKENEITICALETLAATNNINEDHAQALSLYEEAYDLRCKIYGEKDQTTLTTLNNIAVTYGKLGNADKELELLTSISCLQREILGDNHPGTATCLYNLANTYEKKGDKEKAYPLFKTVYEIYCQYIGDENSDTLEVLERFSCIYWSMFISAKESSSNEDYIYWIHNYEELASHAYQYDEFEKAIEFYEKLLSIQSRSGITSVFNVDRMASIYGKLGRSYKETGKYSDSIEFYSKAIELLERLYIGPPETHIRARELSQDYYGIGISFKNIGKNHEAVNAFHKSIELNEKIYVLFCHLSAKESAEAYAAALTIGHCYSELDCAQEAIANYTKVFILAYEAYGPDDCRTNYIREVLQKECCKEYGNSGNLELAKIEYEISVNVFGEEHSETLTNLHNLAYEYCELENYDESLRLYQNAYVCRKRVLGEKHPHTIKTLTNIAYTYYLVGKNQQALELFDKVTESDVSLTEKMIKLISEIYVMLGYPEKGAELRNRLSQTS